MDKSSRYSQGKRITWIGALGNVVLSIVKFVAGVSGRSEALIADAVHSISDLVSDVVVLVSLKVSSRPVDEDRPYGYGRVETVGTGILGIILIIVGINIFWHAIETVNTGVNYIPKSIALAGAFISIIVKEGMYHYTVRVGKKIHSPSIIANAWHHRSDAFSSVASLIGIGAAMMGWPIFDPIAAIIVTVLILKVGLETTIDSFKDIIDTSVKKEIRDKIIDATLSTAGVINYHDLKTRKMGSEILVDIHIEVNPWMNVYEAHCIADKVRDMIVDKVRNISDVLVHIDPEGEADDVFVSRSKEQVAKEISDLVSEIDEVISFRDIMIQYSGNKMIVHINIQLSPHMTVQEGYAKVGDIKDRLLQLDNVSDAIINVDFQKNIK
ncbi:MAG: cation diffusion facilitator family transporter [Proteobacteria bacterium]|nr:cation diffusion facilitator family transporter [Pseudomonadota bacterium]